MGMACCETLWVSVICYGTLWALMTRSDLLCLAMIHNGKDQACILSDNDLHRDPRMPSGQKPAHKKH